MLVQEVVTDLPRAEVLARAREWFTTRFSPYAGFLEDESESHLRFEAESGELVLGVAERDGRTVVRGSTSRMHHELSQFLMTLAPAEEVRQNLIGPGVSGAG
ncbi:MAG TPA: hypothetical protein VF167_03435 [Longimicrobiaceae bacterium]